MRLLMLTHAFNSLAQRLWLELTADGHEISIEYDINDAVTREAVALWRPDAVIAPFLKRAIPADIWSALPCLVVHPGPLGDRGPSALDWAILEGRARWGVSVVQAVAAMDAGPVWAHRSFALRAAAKSSLYRREVTEAAVAATREALARLAAGRGPILPDNIGAEDGKPPMRQPDRAIDWTRMGAAEVLARIHAADGRPGLAEMLGGQRVWLHDAHAAAPGPGRAGAPGAWIARAEGAKHEALLRATADGAVWIGHLRIELPEAGGQVKLPAAAAFARLGLPVPPVIPAPDAPNRVRLRAEGDAAEIAFPFYNGALSPSRARALEAAIRDARDARAILLTGGPEFWSNGIDLACIEASDSPAEASWEAIEAIDDLCLAILEAEDQWTVAAMAGNAGAGGVFMALAADEVLARAGTVLSPHYQNMGGLYGSEYWTYLLPRRLGAAGAARLMATRMPVLAGQAVAMGLIDATLPGEPDGFLDAARARLAATLRAPDFAARLARKRARRATDAAVRPLAAYRAEELDRMRLNFFGFDTSYHVARHDFITAVPKSHTPLHLARHRRGGAAEAPGRAGGLAAPCPPADAPVTAR